MAHEPTNVAAYKIRVTPTFGMWARVEVSRRLNGRRDVIGTTKVRRPIADNAEAAGRAIVEADQARRHIERVSLIKTQQRVSLVKPGRRPAVSLKKA